MPIARIMNMPDGSTPTPVMGGGDQNGTLARSILYHHAGTGCVPIAVPRHLPTGSSTLGIPNPAAPASGPL